MSFTPPALPQNFTAELDALVTEDTDLLLTLLATVRDRLRNAEFPEMIAHDVWDDGESYLALRCPRCESSSPDSSGIMAVDLSERWTTGDEEIDEERHAVSFTYDETAEYEGSHYQCAQCYGPVTLPDGWREQ